MKCWAVSVLLLVAIEQAHSGESLSVAIVPTKSVAPVPTIVTALKRPQLFYVVVSNISDSPISIWEYWSRWGYQSISVEIRLPDGKALVLSRKDEIFTRNFPSSFLIAPGEAQVFPIELDSRWENQKVLLGVCEKQVKVRARFHIHPSNDATTHRVWSGSVHSKLYGFRLLCM